MSYFYEICDWFILGTIIFESKTRFTLVLIIIFVYIIIVTFLHVAADC